MHGPGAPSYLALRQLTPGLPFSGDGGENKRLLTANAGFNGSTGRL
jgi:hypothetical protein